MHRIIRRIAVASIFLLQACAAAEARQAAGAQQGGAVASPEAHLDRPLGRDFELADWNETSGYYRRLDAESPNVFVEKIGTTTEGRDFLIAIISSAANLAQLDQIRAHARTLADPRGKSDEDKRRAIEEGKVILFISPAMHSTETAATQFGMELAHRLATSNDEPYLSAREKLVVCIFPNTNPDGLDHVCEWYRRTVGTPFEASEMLKLYQLYTGHDNNRDWFMLTQAETRIVTEQLYSRWFPQVYWDVHQQGSNRERMFVPPFRDPLNPNLDRAIIAGIDVLGSRALLDMTREGFTGISTGVTYDMWWNGGNRNVPVRHNIIGLLTEAASVRLASPIFLTRGELAAPGDLGDYAPSNQFPAPWPGGWWRIRDIIDYEHAFARSLLGSLAREPQTWLRNCLEASERTIARIADVDDGGGGAAPRAWLIPSDNRDPAAVRRLVEVLLRSGVELHVSGSAIEADGRTYPAGTIVIHRNQPYAAHVKDLFEVQRYPEGAPPYDVAGWTLPLLLGVRRVEVMEDLAAPVAELRRATTVDEALAVFGGDSRLKDARAKEAPAESLSLQHSDTWTKLAAALSAGRTVVVAPFGDDAGLAMLGAADRGQAGAETDELITLRALPRIGIYAPWQGAMDEGWLRYVFDRFAIPYVPVRNEMLRAGALDDFLDVLIIPDISGPSLDRGRAQGTVHDEYAGGLAPEGAVAIEEFVRSGGGTLITLGSSSQWAIDLMRIPLIDVTREEANREFACPGSVLRAIPEAAPLTAGMADSLAVFFARGSAWREMTEQERKERNMTPDGRRGDQAGEGRSEKRDDDSAPSQSKPTTAPQTLLRYAPTRVLLSGWIAKPEVIEGRSAWVRVTHGRGRVHLVAFQPQYRGWSQAAFPIIFRAALLDGGQ